RFITTGTDSVGLSVKDCSDEFLSYFYSSDLIIAKGMGYYETISEIKLKKPLALLLRAKCKPVAEDLKVVQNKNIAKFLKNTS
ncbi:MAG: ARMT1-like domain-containing protein, partial [Candidatus Odinarchaeota archaeon]